MISRFVKNETFHLAKAFKLLIVQIISKSQLYQKMRVLPQVSNKQYESMLQQSKLLFLVITGNGSEENGVCLRPCSSTSTTSSNNEEQAGTASASQYCPRHHHQHRHTPSPSKRHRLTPRPHNIQRPCLDFEKMQQVCLHFKTIKSCLT